jgi:hypothetical protein
MDMAVMSANNFTESQNWFFVFFGVVTLIGSARAVITRQGRTRSKGGHVTPYSGRGAVVRGCVGIVVGAAVLVFGIVNLV